LGICRWIAEAHGGNIFVHSEEGRGSTFTVRLPVTAAPVNMDAEDAHESAREVKLAGTYRPAEQRSGS
jgi:nitrogen-specific signal transduction histidine kinase